MAQEHHRLTIWGFIKGFFKIIIGASLLLQSLLFLIVMIAFVGLMTSISDELSGTSGSGGPSLAVPDGAALVLNPSGVLVEQAADVDPLQEALAEAYGSSRPSEIEVHDVVRAIREAAEDDRIEMLVLDLGNLFIPSIYASKMQYVASALDEFSASGKKIVAIGDYYSQEQYFLAAHADEILMNDYGGVSVIGYGSYRTYYNALIERFNVTNHVFRVGTFKSALEPVLRDDMSPEAKEANEAFLNVLWQEYTTGVEAARGLPQGLIARFANEQPSLLSEVDGDMAQLALDLGLVDQLLGRKQQRQYLIDLVGEDRDGESFKQVGIKTYLYGLEGAKNTDAPDIAVVTAAGTILDGEQPVGVAGGDTIAGLLKDAREDDDVKAVVLRVDSGGGSAFASEVIRNEVLALKEAGKPVIVSMGSLAASGGYWISANADEIWAAPTTVTGSIGIFAFLQTFEDAVGEYGVTVDGVGTTDLSGIQGTGLGPLPEEFGQMIQLSVENGYDRFLSIVGEGRGMTVEQVDNIAQGRVWIGQTANTIGLVDRLGDIDDAIAAAAEMAGVEEYDVVGIAQEKSGFELFLENLMGVGIRVGLIDLEEAGLFDRSELQARQGLGLLVEQAARELEFYTEFNDPNNLYARCMACFVR